MSRPVWGVLAAVRNPVQAAASGHGDQPVGQARQVRGRAQQARHLGRLRAALGAGQYADPPQARRRGLAQLGVPVLQPPDAQLRLRVVEPLRRALGREHPEGQLLQLGAAGRLGEHQPGERLRPRRQQAVLQARPDGPARPGGLRGRGLRREQAVCHAGDLDPARQHRQHPRQPARVQCLTAAAGRQLQRHVLIPGHAGSSGSDVPGPDAPRPDAPAPMSLAVVSLAVVSPAVVSPAAVALTMVARARPAATTWTGPPVRSRTQANPTGPVPPW